MKLLLQADDGTTIYSWKLPSRKLSLQETVELAKSIGTAAGYTQQRESLCKLATQAEREGTRCEECGQTVCDPNTCPSLF